MATIARFKKQVPTDVWCIRERLSLASSVMRSGDQNWVSVSRAIRPFGEPNRAADWFSQKNCALQYSDLLEKVETPKRKRSERGETETPGDQIVRKLTIERIEELKRIVQEEQQKYKKLKRDIEMVRAGQLDDRLSETWEEVQQQKKVSEEAAAMASRPTEEDADARAAAQARLQSKPVVTPNKPKRLQPGLKLLMEDSTSTSLLETDSIKVEDTSNVGQTTPSGQTVADGKPKPTAPSSPLLSSLLQTLPDRQKMLAVQQGQISQLLKGQTQASPTCPDPSQTACSETVQPEPTVMEQTLTITLPTIEIKEEPIDSDVTITTTPEPDTALVEPGSPVQTSPVDNPAAVTTTTPPPTTAPVVPPSTLTTAVKSEVPNSPSAEVKEEGQTRKTLTPELPITPTTPTTQRRDSYAGKQDPSLPQEAAIESLKQTATGGIEEDPASPASSIVSNETDSGSAKGVRGSGKRTRGRKGRRISHRLTRGRIVQEEEKAASSGKPSEAESSDDDGCQAESDDGTSAITTKTALSISESIPNSPASLSQCDTEDEKAYKVWKKSIMLVWRAAANHKYANVFLHPVTNEIAPGYLGIVYRPMDLSAIKKNIETGALRTTAEFQRDMMLMFTNAIMYNNSDHDVYNMAVEMYNDVMIHIEQYVNTQMMVQSETKILRQSRRSEAGASDKEEDPKKRKLSTENEHGGKSKKRK